MTLSDYLIIIHCINNYGLSVTILSTTVNLLRIEQGRYCGSPTHEIDYGWWAAF